MNSIKSSKPTLNGQRRVEDLLPWDTEQDYGGWGGHQYHNTPPGRTHTPVVFVHGNRRTADDWLPHAEALVENGWSGDAIWAITFSEATTSHDQMATELDEFVSHVQGYTDSQKISLVAHSLGVTGARWWMETTTSYDSVDTFVGIAGANHGLYLATIAARAGMNEGALAPVEFLRDDYRQFDDHPLQRLNEPTETPGDVDYYTVRGTKDALFVNSLHSPVLEGAEDNKVLHADHDGVRLHDETIELLAAVL